MAYYRGHVVNGNLNGRPRPACQYKNEKNDNDEADNVEVVVLNGL